MTRILITIDWFLPGTNSGGPVRSVANLIAALPECQFYVFTRNTDYCTTEAYEGITPNTWVKFSENCEVYYCSEQNLSKATLTAQLKAIAPDALYINGIYSKAFSRWPVSIGKALKLKTVVAARGMLSPHALAVKPLKKYIFLSFMRWINRYSKVIFHATSVAEVQDIQLILGNRVQVRNIPNLAREKSSIAKEIVKEAGKSKLVYIGRIAPEKGTLLALSALKEQKGSIVLDLYGTCYNEAYWNECLQVIAQLPSNIKVNYNGPCPSDEVAAHLAAAHALLLPSEGENYGHSIVESLGQGRPVLISKHTPWQDLAAQKAGWDVTHTDLPPALAELAAMDQARYDEWCRGAAEYYEKQILVPFAEHQDAYLKLFSVSTS
jgi:glycosyltransferase involved in cell wall biosynthesis